MTVQPIGQNLTPSSAPPLSIKDPSVISSDLTVLHTVQPRDSVDIGESPLKAGTYKREEVSGERLRADQQQMSALLRRMAEKLITEQYEKGNHLFQLLYGGMAVELDPMIRAPQISAQFENESDLLMQAEETVGADGYYGVAQTGTRILEFSKALSGGDNSKADMMRRSVEDAFQSLGPPMRQASITKRTFEAVTNGFDAWASEKPTAPLTAVI